MRLTDFSNALNLTCLTLLCILTQGCQTSSGKSRLTEMWSLDTSIALADACRQDLDPADPGHVQESIEQMGSCIQNLELASEWHRLVRARIVEQWPQDFIDTDKDNRACLESLTNSLLIRFASEAVNSCPKANLTSHSDTIAESVEQMKANACTALVGMTADGCFIQRDCNLASSKPEPGKQNRKDCRPLIQKIHKVKDPENKNLAWIDPFVIELTGNRSSARVTYGLPNCHGTAQAAAGNLLGDLFLEGISFARLHEKEICGSSVEAWFSKNKSKPLRDLQLNPGGLIINMNHRDCAEHDCGKVNLWIDHCEAEAGSESTDVPFAAGIFIDDMCVECWARMLEKKGFHRSRDAVAGATGKKIKPGCILTASDHSVYVVHESAGWCYSYEATSPYGPPQLRTAPCLAMQNRFENHFCP